MALRKMRYEIRKMSAPNAVPIAKQSHFKIEFWINAPEIPSVHIVIFAHVWTGPIRALRRAQSKGQKDTGGDGVCMQLVASIYPLILTSAICWICESRTGVVIIQKE